MEHARDPAIYRGPLFLIQRSFQNDRIVGAKCSDSVVYSRTYFGVPCEDRDELYLDLLNAFVNSTLSVYCVLLTSTSFGLDRQFTEQNDFNRLPFKAPTSAAEVQDLIGVVRRLEHANEVTDLSELDEAVFDFYNLPQWQREYIPDTVRFDFDFVRHGSEGISARQPDSDDLKAYAETMVRFLRGNLNGDDLKVNADIIDGLADVCAVVIRFDESRHRGVRVTVPPDEPENGRLADLLHARVSSGFQLRRSLVHFDDDRCIIIKLAQKRFWSRARAYDDADTIFAELLRPGE